MKSMASVGEIKKSLEDVETVDFETVELEDREKDIMSLENSPGWKAIEKELREWVENLETEIFDIRNDLTNEERKERLIRRYYLVELINLPKVKRELFTLRKEGTTLVEEL